MFLYMMANILIDQWHNAFTHSDGGIATFQDDGHRIISAHIGEMDVTKMELARFGKLS